MESEVRVTERISAINWMVLIDYVEVFRQLRIQTHKHADKYCFDQSESSPGRNE